MRPDKTFSPLPNKDGENPFLVLAVTTLNQDTGDTGLWTPNSQQTQQVNRLFHGFPNQKIHRAQWEWSDITY